MIWLTKSSLITVSIKNIDLEAATWGVLEKKVFLKISKNFKEIHGVFFFCFPVNFRKFLRTPVSQKIYERLAASEQQRKFWKLFLKKTFKVFDYCNLLQAETRVQRSTTNKVSCNTTYAQRTTPVMEFIFLKKMDSLARVLL